MVWIGASSINVSVVLVAVRTELRGNGKLPRSHCGYWRLNSRVMVRGCGVSIFSAVFGVAFVALIIFGVYVSWFQLDVLGTSKGNKRLIKSHFIDITLKNLICSNFVTRYKS